MVDTDDKREKKLNGHRTPKIFASQLHPKISSPTDTVTSDFSTIINTEFMTSVRTEVPPDARTAPYLGIEREGNAVAIGPDGLLLTVGYLLLESRTIRAVTKEGNWVPADYVGYDFESGFGLARAREPLNLTPIEFGESAKLATDSAVIVAAHGGENHWLNAKITGRREFAGYWEYLIENAIFTTPAHPNWSGAALIDSDGKLNGIGSLLVDDAMDTKNRKQGNMFVPIELLTPILDDLLKNGRSQQPTRPWVGMFTAETQTGLAIVHVTPGGPAQRSGIEVEDVILRINEEPIADLADMYRKIWRLGTAGTVIPMTLMRDTVGVEVTVKSSNRYDYFVTPRD